MEDKKFNLLAGIGALILVVLQSAGVLSLNALLTILAVIWVLLTGRVVIRYLRKGQIGMALCAGALGAVMILLVMRELG